MTWKGVKRNMNNYVVNTKNYNKRIASNSDDKRHLFDFEERSSTFYDLHFGSARIGGFNLEKSTMSKLQRKMFEACKEL